MSDSTDFAVSLPTDTGTFTASSMLPVGLLDTNHVLLLADDVSSALDARTELELWGALQERGSTVVGASSKRAALSRADRVVVLVAGRMVAAGPWEQLRDRWGHLAG